MMRTGTRTNHRIDRALSFVGLVSALTGCSENETDKSDATAAMPSSSVTSTTSASTTSTTSTTGQPSTGEGSTSTTDIPTGTTSSTDDASGSGGSASGGAGGDANDTTMASAGGSVGDVDAGVVEEAAEDQSGGGAGGVPTDVEAGSDQPSVTSGDDFSSDIEVMVHDQVNTLLVVRWNQTVAADQVWLEFSFENDEWATSRPQVGDEGPHRDVVLGVPGDTTVQIRIVSSIGDNQYASTEFEGTTEAVPAGMPVPEVLAYNPQRSTPDRYLFGAVEDSLGGSFTGYYLSTFWLYIMDKQGRIVWYYADPSSNATSSFQRIAKDGGEYIWLEKRCYGCGAFQESVVRMTLDWELFEELQIPGLSDCIDVTDEGTVLYDAGYILRERLVDGETRDIWNCRDHFGQNFECYTNTINWNAEMDSVLMSYPYEGTVVEISRADGELIGQYGNRDDSWDFAPPLETPPEQWGFGFQHFPNISPQGTLMVSSHMPGYEQTDNPVANQHAFLEFEIDRENQRLVELWRYNDGPEWPHAKGMAIRLDNGNTLGNYGTGGAIREITPDKETVFHVKFDVAEGDDFYNKMVGNNVFVDDLYALNGGLPQATQ
jgi:hypothetical protein